MTAGPDVEGVSSGGRYRVTSTRIFELAQAHQAGSAITTAEAVVEQRKSELAFVKGNRCVSRCSILFT